MAFRIGQEVCCIMDLSQWCSHGEVAPIVGKIYKIRAISESRTFHGESRIKLLEIINEPKTYDIGIAECWYSARFFRPVVKTNIEIFTAMLTPTPHKVTAS